MIERIERFAPTRGLTVPGITQRARQPRAAGSVLAMPRGEIAGDVRLLERSDRDRIAIYEVLVANDTGRPVAAFAYALEAGRRPGRVTWNAMVVPPYSAISVEIDVAIPRRGRLPRVVAEVHAEDAQLTLDSAPAIERFPPAVIRRAGAAAAALTLAAGTFAGAVSARPRVAALAAPPSVIGGSEFSVAYALTGASSAGYTIEAPDGLQVRRGTLAPGSGAFTAALPPGANPAGYDLHVFANGRFGSDERSMHLVAVAPPESGGGPAGAKIEKLALAADSVHAGTPIVVHYRTPAKTGTVRLIDEYGTVRAEALLGRSGTSMLVAPDVDADQDLRVVVTAERGSERDEAQVPVRVLRADPNAGGPGAAAVASSGLIVPAPEPLDASNAVTAGAAAAAPPPPLPGTAAPAATTGVREAFAVPNGAPISIAHAQAADKPIVVRVLRYEPKMHVAVLGKSGEELEGADVAPGDEIVSLSSPRELGTNHPSIVATYENGSEQETIVRAVNVAGARTHTR